MLVELHGPDGQRFFVNPAAVTTIREPLTTDQRHFAPGMRCVVVMSNGKFLPVHESCDEVRGLMERK